MTDKRFFSHSETINFKDYLQNKKGVEILKNINSKQSGKIQRFLNYEQFICLTKTYFRYIQPDAVSIQIPINIYHSNSSFLIYQNILSHIKDCSNCKLCKDVYKLNNCKEIKRILYPYGQYIDTDNRHNISLHSRFDAGDWCAKCKVNVNGNENEMKALRSELRIVDGCEQCSHVNTNLNPLYNRNKYVFPSQNTFVIEDIDNDIQCHDTFIQEQRMNAFALFPNIKNCEKQVERKEETKKVLCGKTTPLFI